MELTGFFVFSILCSFITCLLDAHYGFGPEYVTVMVGEKETREHA